jgi:hypothetical protein
MTTLWDACTSRYMTWFQMNDVDTQKTINGVLSNIRPRERSPQKDPG